MSINIMHATYKADDVIALQVDDSDVYELYMNKKYWLTLWFPGPKKDKQFTDYLDNFYKIVHSPSGDIYED